MKKLFFLLFLLGSRLVYGQAGAITIDNKNTICGVYVTMYAEDIGLYPHCSLMSNQIYLSCAGCTSSFPSSVSFPSHGAFTTAFGWFSGGTPSAGSLSFRWNEAQFQFDCPINAGCSNGGDFLNPATTLGGGLYVRCSLPIHSTIASSAGGCVTNLTWRPTFSNTMSNIIVTFN